MIPGMNPFSQTLINVIMFSGGGLLAVGLDLIIQFRDEIRIPGVREQEIRVSDWKEETTTRHVLECVTDPTSCSTSASFAGLLSLSGGEDAEMPLILLQATNQDVRNFAIKLLLIGMMILLLFQFCGGVTSSLASIEY